MPYHHCAVGVVPLRTPDRRHLIELDLDLHLPPEVLSGEVELSRETVKMILTKETRIRWLMGEWQKHGCVLGTYTGGTGRTDVERRAEPGHPGCALAINQETHAPARPRRVGSLDRISNFLVGSCGVCGDKNRLHTAHTPAPTPIRPIAGAKAP